MALPRITSRVSMRADPERPTPPISCKEEMFLSRKTVTLAATALVLLSAVMGGCGAKVTFSDPGLARAVARHLGVEADAFDRQAVAKITDLDATRSGIASLDGIAAMMGLSAIALDANQLTDLQQLADAELENLKEVSVVDNPLPVALDSPVYAEVAALRRKGVAVQWLPTFIASFGQHGRLTDLDQSPDGSLVAINEGSLLHVSLFGQNPEWFQPPDNWPGLANIVPGDGIIFCNGSPFESTQWEHAFEFPGGFTSTRSFSFPRGVYEMIPAPDSSYLVVGIPFEQLDSAVVAKLDANREQVWLRIVQDIGGGQSAIALSDGCIVLTDKAVARLNAEGDTVGTIDLSTYGSDVWWLPRMATSQNTYTIVGSYTRQPGSAVILTFTADLQTITAVRTSVPGAQDGELMVYGFDTTEDGGFVLTAHNWAFPETPAGGLLSKVDATGKILWSRSFPEYALNPVIETADGGFAVGAHAADWTTVIIKTDANGLVDAK